jgi:hypothetical protein
MLHHEHIVDITDFGYTKQGLAFLTMEHLEGEDLATCSSARVACRGPACAA